MKRLFLNPAAMKRMFVLPVIFLVGLQCVMAGAGPAQIVCQATGHIVTAATGTGTWVALSSNPSQAWISSPSSAITGMADFDSVGVYAFQWGTAPGDTLYVTVFPAQVIKPVLTFSGPCQDTLIAHGPAGTVSASWINNFGNVVFNATDTILVATAPGSYVAYLESDSGCQSEPSDTLYVTLTVPAVSFTPLLFDICQGQSDTFTSTPVNGGTAPTYQWYQDGVPVGSNSPVYITSTAQNDISVVMTSNLPALRQQRHFMRIPFMRTPYLRSPW